MHSLVFIACCCCYCCCFWFCEVQESLQQKPKSICVRLYCSTDIITTLQFLENNLILVWVSNLLLQTAQRMRPSSNSVTGLEGHLTDQELELIQEPLRSEPLVTLTLTTTITRFYKNYFTQNFANPVSRTS